MMHALIFDDVKSTTEYKHPKKNEQENKHEDNNRHNIIYNSSDSTMFSTIKPP